MQPGSNKHGPVADESLAKDVRGLVVSNRGNRSEEWLDPEPPADNEPSVDYAAGSHDSDVEENPMPDRRSVRLRSELASSLRRSLFPADRAGLLAHADAKHLTDEIHGLLEALPANTKFRNVEDVWEQCGKPPDAKRF